MAPVTALAVSSKSLDLRPLTRALQLRKASDGWCRLKGEADRYRLRCQRCGSAVLELVNEPCVRKRHTQTAHRRRTLVKCLLCRHVVWTVYGA